MCFTVPKLWSMIIVPKHNTTKRSSLSAALESKTAMGLSSQNKISQLQPGAQRQRLVTVSNLFSLSNNTWGHSSLQITNTKMLMATKIQQRFLLLLTPL